MTSDLSPVKAPMLELVNVTKNFGQKTAVDNLSISLRSGELYAFLGPNGAGKTTTIKMICGLLAPTSGHIRIEGVTVSMENRGARQALGYVPDEPYLYEKLSGREFLQFVLEMYNVEPKLGQSRMDQLIDIFEMAQYIDGLSESYSHGMRQRVVLAAALIRDPKILIVDEPMVGLDPKTARLVKDLLRERATAGCVVFMSTHTLSVAEEVADTIAIINRGHLLTSGTLSDLKTKMAQDGSLEELFLNLTQDLEQ